MYYDITNYNSVIIEFNEMLFGLCLDCFFYYKSVIFFGGMEKKGRGVALSYNRVMLFCFLLVNSDGTSCVPAGRRSVLFSAQLLPSHEKGSGGYCGFSVLIWAVYWLSGGDRTGCAHDGLRTFCQVYWKVL